MSTKTTKTTKTENQYHVIRTDAPEQIVACESLEDAERVAETQWELAHYTDKPQYDIQDRCGNLVAYLIDGRLVRR